MIHERVRVLTLATAGCAVFFSDGVAQDQVPVRFADPVRIKAGDAHLGEGRILPSPALHDIDRDGCPDVVIGDLHGCVTVARRSNESEKSVLFDAEQPLKDRSGEPLKFHNW
jgi:hypothetical protein